MKVPCEKCPCLYVATSWNSMYNMLESAMTFKKALSSLASLDPNYECAPSLDDRKVAETIKKLLKIFYHATKSGLRMQLSSLRHS